MVRDGANAREIAHTYGNGPHRHAVIADLLGLAAHAGDRPRAYQRLTLAPMRAGGHPEPPSGRRTVYAPRETDDQNFARKMRTGALAIARRGERVCTLCGTRLARDNATARWCSAHNPRDAVNPGNRAEIEHAMHDLFSLMPERCRPDLEALARLDELADTDQLAAWLDPVAGPLLDMPYAPAAARGPWQS